MSNTHHSAVARRDAQVAAELTTIVDQLRAVAEKHDLSIVDVEKTLRRMVRQVARDEDLDLGVLDLPAKDRARLRALDTHGRARP